MDMATRKICVEQYNKAQSGVKEVVDPSNLFGGSKSEPFVTVFSEKTIDVRITNDLFVDDNSTINRESTFSPLNKWRENLIKYLIYEENIDKDNLFISKLTDTLYWFGYRYCRLNLFNNYLSKDELLHIRGTLKDKVDITEYEDRWHIYFFDNINSNCNDSYGANINLHMEIITEPGPKRKRGWDISF